MPFLGLLLSLQALMATQWTAFDSIANPLLKASPGTDLQREGDQKNLQIGRVRVNQAGYRLGDVRAGRAEFRVVAQKTLTEAVVHGQGKTWKVPLVSMDTSVQSQWNAKYVENSLRQPNVAKPEYPKAGTVVAGALYSGTLPSDLPSGSYSVTADGESSASFLVSPNVYGMVRDASMLFYGIQRSGSLRDETGIAKDSTQSPSWFRNKPSHTWDGWLYDTTGVGSAKNRYKGALSGGWYDCGDHIKESRTNSYTLAMLGVIAATLPQSNMDHFGFVHSSPVDGIPDAIREGKWGAAFAIRAWNLAGGAKMEPKKLNLSVGDFGRDHSWWGSPEVQDTVSDAYSGNRTERLVRNDWGSASLADWAAGLAFLSRLWRPYDTNGWSDSALQVSKAFYALAKSRNALDNTPSYYGESKANDDLSLAATALLWATGQKSYLQELAYTPGLPNGVGGTCGASNADVFPASNFVGGYLGCGSDNMRRSNASSDWASIQNPSLYAFYKLILAHPDTAMRYGVSDEAERAGLIEKIITGLTQNVSGRSMGAGKIISFPQSQKSAFGALSLTYDPNWYALRVTQDWFWNNYQLGNLSDLWMYLDVTGSIVSGKVVLPNTTNPDWKRQELMQVLLGGTNALLGMNPWDLSWILGVGSKNPMHPHHRAANPEGRNREATAAYTFQIPVGAVYAGSSPFTTKALTDWWEDYRVSEVCLSNSPHLTLVATGLAQDSITDTAQIDTPIVVGLGAKHLHGAGRVQVQYQGQRVVLQRDVARVARLELYSVSGEALSSRLWSDTQLELPRTRAMRIVRIVDAQTSQTILLAP